MELLGVVAGAFFAIFVLAPIQLYYEQGPVIATGTLLLIAAAIILAFRLGGIAHRRWQGRSRR